MLAIRFPNPKASSKNLWHNKYVEAILKDRAMLIEACVPPFTEWQRAQGAELSLTLADQIMHCKGMQSMQPAYS